MHILIFLMRTLPISSSSLCEISPAFPSASSRSLIGKVLLGKKASQVHLSPLPPPVSFLSALHRPRPWKIKAHINIQQISLYIPGPVIRTPQAATEVSSAEKYNVLIILVPQYEWDSWVFAGLYSVIWQLASRGTCSSSQHCLLQQTKMQFSAVDTGKKANICGCVKDWLTDVSPIWQTSQVLWSVLRSQSTADLMMFIGRQTTWTLYIVLRDYNDYI